MLPCPTNCSGYCPGCHKHCAQWQRFQEDQRQQRLAKKQYLRFYGQLCSQLTYQLTSMQARYSVR